MKQQQELIKMSAGEYLKQQRIERELSLAAIAQALHLDEKLLGDIEQGQTDHIAWVYRNGYIKAYAAYLQIPEGKIQTLMSSAEIKEPAVRNIFPAPPRRKPMDKWLRATGYVLASLLIGTLAWQFTHEAVRLSQNGSRLHHQQDNAADPRSTTFQDQAQALRGPVNASIASLEARRDSDADGPGTAGQTGAAVSRPVLAEGESRLQISVSADSWIEITDADGHELEMDLLRGGREKTYHGKPPFRMLFGRASAVRLSMDGEPVDLAAYTQDDVAQLRWPQKLPAGNNGPSDN